MENENKKINTYYASKRITPAKRIAFAAMFTSLAIVLSIMESYIPIGAIIPVPGVKLGLANIVTVFAIITLKPQDTLFIILTRCFVMGLYTGIVALAFSLAGAIFAFLIMQLLLFGLGKTFSVVGISMAGAAAHNIGQIIVAVILLGDIKILYFYLPFLMIVSIFTGAITGIAAIPVIRTVKRAVS